MSYNSDDIKARRRNPSAWYVWASDITTDNHKSRIFYFITIFELRSRKRVSEGNPQGVYSSQVQYLFPTYYTVLTLGKLRSAPVRSVL